VLFIYPSSVPEIKFEAKLGISGLQKKERKQESLFAPPCRSALFGWSLFWIPCAWYDEFFYSCFNLYLTNAPDPFKSVSYERTKWVRCGHLNAPHSHIQA